MSIILLYSRNISQWIHASSKALTLSWRRFLSYRNQSNDLFCKSMDWFLYNRDLLHGRFNTLFNNMHREFVLTCCKAYLLSFFFSIWLFFLEYSRFTGQKMKGEAISLYPFYHFYPLHRHLDISWVIAAEGSPLRITGSRNRKWNLCDTLFRIHSFRTCTGRKMLKT